MSIAVIVWQLFIFFTIFISGSKRGVVALFWVLWTLVQVYALPLSIIQFLTIYISYKLASPSVPGTTSPQHSNSEWMAEEEAEKRYEAELREAEEQRRIVAREAEKQRAIERSLKKQVRIDLNNAPILAEIDQIDQKRRPLLADLYGTSDTKRRRAAKKLLPLDTRRSELTQRLE